MSYVAMYQKFRLIRERNQLELQQIGYSTKLARIEKNITKKEKYYTGLFEKLRQQATNFKNQAKIGMQGMFGLGQGSVNPLNYTGTNGFVINSLGSILSSGQMPLFDKDNNWKRVDGSTFTLSQDKLQLALQYYQQYGGLQPVRENGNIKYQEDGKTPVYEGDFTAEEAYHIQMAFSQAQNNYQYAQMMMNQATTAYDTNVSIWLEAQEAQLQAEQDSVIGALQYEQAIMEIDNTYCEQRLKRIDQEIQSYDKLIDDRTEKNVPKFGLG